MWKYTADDKENAISLHDCVATHATVVDGNLQLDFEDGFWVLGEGIEDTFRSGYSRIQFLVCEIAHIYGYHRYSFFRKPVMTLRKEIALQVFLKNINQRKWKLEFITTYRTYNCYLFQCCMWNRGKSYGFECEFQVDASTIEYYWNEVRTNCPW